MDIVQTEKKQQCVQWKQGADIDMMTGIYCENLSDGQGWKK